MRTIIVLTSALLLNGATALAQSDFAQLRIPLGDKVYAIYADGTEVGGRVTSVTATRLTIGRYDLAAEPGLRLERRGDDILSGTAIGAGIGMLAMAAVCTESDCIAAGAITYGLFGALLDWAHVGHKTIYQIRDAPTVAKRSLDVAPLLTRNRAAVGVRFSF